MSTPLKSDVSDRLRLRLQAIRNWLISKGIISSSSQREHKQSPTTKVKETQREHKQSSTTEVKGASIPWMEGHKFTDDNDPPVAAG